MAMLVLSPLVWQAQVLGFVQVPRYLLVPATIVRHGTCTCYMYLYVWVIGHQQPTDKGKILQHEEEELRSYLLCTCTEYLRIGVASSVSREDSKDSGR